VNLVDEMGGVTIIPQLSIFHLNAEQKSKVMSFIKPVPVRSVTLATHVYYPRLKLKNKLAQLLQNTLQLFQKNDEFEIVGIQ